MELHDGVCNAWDTFDPVTIEWGDRGIDEPDVELDSANASSYDVYFGTASNPPLVTTTTSASYSPSGSSNSTTYYWKIVAKNSCGDSTTESVWSFTTACGTPGTPSLSSPLNGATGISTSPTLSWTSSRCNFVRVYFGTASNPPLVATNDERELFRLPV